MFYHNVSATYSPVFLHVRFGMSYSEMVCISHLLQVISVASTKQKNNLCTISYLISKLVNNLKYFQIYFKYIVGLLMILIPISNLPDLFTKFEKINLHLPEKWILVKPNVQSLCLFLSKCIQVQQIMTILISDSIILAIYKSLL